MNLCAPLTPNEWGCQLQEWSAQHPAAQLCLALLLYNADCVGKLAGMPPDPQRAQELARRGMSWCRDAAGCGEPVAQWLLGLCLLHSIGAAANAPQAAALFEQASERSAEAHYWLGRCYECGMGVPEDQALAKQWYAQAAAQRHAEAIYKLVYLAYIDGDREQAKCLLQVAADMGHADARAFLCMCQ